MSSDAFLNKNCPCGLEVDGKGISYQECCQPYHLGQANPATPELLMRSRYSAFYKGLGQYIFDTHHQNYRQGATVEDYTQSAQSTNWCGLEVVKANQEVVTGIVEFKAYFIDGEKLHCLHEISNFVLENSKWLYTDGQYQPKKVSKISRNDACPYQSGIKAKKCCLK